MRNGERGCRDACLLSRKKYIGTTMGIHSPVARAVSGNEGPQEFEVLNPSPKPLNCAPKNKKDSLAALSPKP